MLKPYPSATADLPFERALGVGKEAVLYGDPTSKEFGLFHKTLYEAAQKGELRYKLRYRKSPEAPAEALPVSGYGVELALKKTDYIVIDDREASQDGSQKPVVGETLLDEEEDIADLKPLSTSELSELGLRAASFVLQSEQPLDSLVKLTQDLPKFSSAIASHDISEVFLAEHKNNREKAAPGGINYLWMNGVQLIERQIEPFTLVDMIRRERKLLSGVRDLGFSGKQAVSLLGHREVATAKAQDEAPRFDWTDRNENGRVIIWLNDLEADERYSSYPKTLQAVSFTFQRPCHKSNSHQLLQRTAPGQLPPIGLNIFNLVLPVDMADIHDVKTVIQILYLMKRGIPIRFGLVPLAFTSDATHQAKVAYHLAENYGVEALADYLEAFEEDVKIDLSEKVLSATISNHKLQEDSTSWSLADILKADGYIEQINLANKWSRRLNADTSTRPIFADGVAIPREKNWLQAVSSRFFEDLQIMQMGVFQGQLDDDIWAPSIFLEKASSRRNTYILPDEGGTLNVLNVNKILNDHSKVFDNIPVLESSTDTTKENWAVLTAVADLNTLNGRELVLEALQFKHNNPGVRLDIIHNPEPGQSASKVNSALHDKGQLASIKTQDELTQVLQAAEFLDPDASFDIALSEFLATSKLQPGSQLVLLNGRVVGPIGDDASFSEDDFLQLLEYERSNRILPVYAALEDLGLADKLSDPIAAAKITSLIALSSISDLPEGIFESAPGIRTTIYDQWESKYSAIEVGDPEKASVHIAGLLNPLSEQGQRWAPILKVLSELDGVYLKLFINPKNKITELPVKRFYRYVLESRPSFDESGKPQHLNATFRGLPSETLLTVGMNVPPAWLVSPEVSVHDLDNIKLSSLKGDVEALYELENILIEGHSRETKGSPPRGAQLVLGSGATPLLDDTIVMANLGYFQFKANPGYYSIKLKEGRSADIYDIESIGAQGYEAVPGDEGTDVALMDFQGATLYPRLKRKPGMERADVLDEDENPDGSIVSKGLKFAESLFGGGSKARNVVSAEEHAEINIFSVASGHLYERMLNIMMVSVMRNTKHTVKFWFIEQFLSPEFKDFIPYMAKEYGFKYEMVTYKWPHWLRQQKEKQREIWGYKILFLDVLFPLSLDKVIFVDADQIVRTDMIDLVHHDLEGAPYGFTPMCDSRTEMEGFRFWKQGYWANFLRGRPYHISALYVVDLRRFREIAAGDRLRQQYHALSADPNSLSNLDQDLPNNMQHQIPIHSLPQEWLWCETWCSDESQKDARTIDLCNNPETKEPKLDRARRQVPEWTVFDEEIKALDSRRRVLEGKGAQGQNTKSRRFEEEHIHTKDEL